MLKIYEWLMLLAGVLLLLSLPLLADGSYSLWLGAQVLYFIGVAVMITGYFFERRA